MTKSKDKPAKAAQPRRTGRPSLYSENLVDTICRRIAEGESLVSICADRDMPSRDAVHTWLDTKPGFADKYVRARLLQADKYAEEIIAIADDGTRDKTVDAEGNEIVDHDHIQRSKLRVDARKWAASKLAPKKYGDKLELAGDASSPLTVNVITKFSEDA